MSIEQLSEPQLVEAIKDFEKALKVFKKDEAPTGYARYILLIGLTYAALAKFRDKEANLKLARKAYEEALTIFTKDSNPEFYEKVMENLKSFKIPIHRKILNFLRRAI